MEETLHRESGTLGPYLVISGSVTYGSYLISLSFSFLKKKIT